MRVFVFKGFIVLSFLAISSAIAADKASVVLIEGFSVDDVPLYGDNSSKNKLKKVKKEEIPTPIEVVTIGGKKRFYQIKLNGETVWVRKRHVLTSNVKATCLKLSSNTGTHVAGSRALFSGECKDE